MTKQGFLVKGGAGLGNLYPELMGRMCLAIFHPVSGRVMANSKHLPDTLPSPPLHPGYRLVILPYQHLPFAILLILQGQSPAGGDLFRDLMVSSEKGPIHSAPSTFKYSEIHSLI